MLLPSLTLFSLFAVAAWAQIGLGGFNAVMTVPTARMQPDGALAIGFGYIPQPEAVPRDQGHENLAYFASIGFLPLLEVSLRVTQILHDSLTDIVDRMVSLRVLVIPESGGRPAVVFGLHDFLAIQGRRGWFNALYTVLTKGFLVSKGLLIEMTAGYGVDWMKARSHEFAGPFGGLSMGNRELLFLKTEYDARKFNYGMTLQIRKSLTTTIVLLDGKFASCGANLQIML